MKDQYERFKKLVKVTRIYQKTYFEMGKDHSLKFSAERRDILAKAKVGEGRIDEFLEGGILQEDLTIQSPVHQENLFG